MNFNVIYFFWAFPFRSCFSFQVLVPAGFPLQSLTHLTHCEDFFILIGIFFFNLLQHPKKTIKRKAKFSFVGQSARVIQALLRRALALLPSSLFFNGFLFFRFFFWVCCCFARGLSLLLGGWFRGLLVAFFCLSWLLLLCLFCLRALFVSFRVRVRLGFAVLVPLFPLPPFGLRWLRSFLLSLLFRAVVCLVFAPSFGALFLGLRFFRLLLLVVVVVRSLLVRLLSFVPFVRARFLCGCRSRVGLALLGWCPRRFLLAAFVVLARALGLRLLSLVVWACLLCCSSLLVFALLLGGVFSRWARGGFFAPSIL